MVRSIFLVRSDATGQDTVAEFDRWYSEKQIQDVSNVPGVVSATRYHFEKGVIALPGVNADRYSPNPTMADPISEQQRSRTFPGLWKYDPLREGLVR